MATPRQRSLNWQRLNYLVHRWLGIVLGLLVFVWFASGIVLIYYPWPAPTASEELARRPSFEVPSDLIGFARAHLIAQDAMARWASRQDDAAADPIVGGRLEAWNGTLAYVFWRQREHVDVPALVMDGRTGLVYSPISDSAAVGTAREVVGRANTVAHVTLLAEGDHYLMSREYESGFPAYKVDFRDPANTAVYVSQAGANVVGVVTTLTRWTTWLGTVPHWLYFKWLYSRRFTLWLWVSYVLPAIAALGGLAGIIIGTYQLFPRRRRGEWRVSSYHGLSKWHHLTGIVFGALVLTWTVSGVLEVLGPENFPEAAQIVRARGRVPWDRIRIRESEAVRRASRLDALPVLPVAVDLTALDGSVGYGVHWRDGRTSWVDAESGRVRGELSETEARAIAARALGRGVPVLATDRIVQYDAYYYARPYREMPLPTYRVSFADPDHSTLYLDPVSGKPVGYVFAESRTYRWLRDGLHSFDIPGINGRRPLWDIALLVPMLGGTVIAFTGVWLLFRRLWRIGRRTARKLQV